MLQTLGTVALRLTTLGSLAFVVLFATLAPWRRTLMGRHMMTFMCVITSILVYLFVAPFLGDLSLQTRMLIRLVCYALLGGVIWWRVYLLAAAQAANLRRTVRGSGKALPGLGSNPSKRMHMDKYAKALVAAALAVLAALLPAVGDGHISAAELVIMVTAGLATLTTVWGVPNSTPPVPASLVQYDPQHDTQ